MRANRNFQGVLFGEQCVLWGELNNSPQSFYCLTKREADEEKTSPPDALGNVDAVVDSSLSHIGQS